MLAKNLTAFMPHSRGTRVESNVLVPANWRRRFQKIVLFIAIASASIASAKQLSAQDIRARLQLNADIYLVDASGKKVLSGPSRTNYWRSDAEKGTVDSDWSTQNEDGLIAFRQRWHIEEDGTIKVALEEYATLPNIVRIQSSKIF